MRIPRILALGVGLVMVLAACGGGTAATQAPGATAAGPAATDGGGGAPTDGPQATADNGDGSGDGGASGGGGTGTAKFHVTGPVERSGELPFFAFGSRFGGAAGVALNFTKSDDETGGLFSIADVNGAHAISAINDEYAMSWADCATFELNITGENATGRFECDNGVATKVADGSYITGLKLSGTFEAHA